MRCFFNSPMSPFPQVEMSLLRDNKAFLTTTRRKCNERRGLLYVCQRNSTPRCYQAVYRFAQWYLQKYNQRFAKQPLNSDDYHRPVLATARPLALVLSQQHERKLSKNLICQHHNIPYLIQTQQPSYALRGARVTVCELLNGEIVILYKGRELLYTTYRQHSPRSQSHDEKTINQAVAELLAKPRTVHKPKPDHPWRRNNADYLSTKRE